MAKVKRMRWDKHPSVTVVNGKPMLKVFEEYFVEEDLPKFQKILQEDAEKNKKSAASKADNGLIDPEPYYRRALEIDPDYSKANLAMGVRLAKNGSCVEAKPYLEKAVARATQNHTRALDAAPEYYLALVERQLGNLKRAEDLFWRCTWRLTHKKESYVELARIAALRGDWAEALARIDDALALGQDEAKLWTMKGIFLRKLTSDFGQRTSEMEVGCQKSEVKNLCGLSAALREINNPKVCFEKAIKCDPRE